MLTLTKTKLWRIMERPFYQQKEFYIDRYMLLTTKQVKSGSIEHIYGELEELSQKCEL